MAVKDLVEKAIAENKVTIFSKSYCPYCQKAKGLISSKYPDAETKIFELDEIDEGGEIQNYLQTKTGQRTVPNIFINKEHIGGNDSLQGLEKQGKLSALINA